MTRAKKTQLIGGIWISINAYFLGRDVVLAAFKQTVHWTTAGWITLAWCVWGLLTPAALWCAERFPLERRRWLTRVPLHALFALAFWFAVSIIFSLGIWLFEPATTSYGSVLMTNIRTYGFMTDIITYGTILAVHHAIKYHRRKQQETLRVIRLQTALLESQLQALQMQLHPHFLFNTLHSISELVHEDPATATQMLQQLERFLQLTLHDSTDQCVPLKQELEFLRCYLDIQQVRFRDSLTVIMDIDEKSIPLPVPSLILQPIVENAIRHGSPSNSIARSITVKASTEARYLKLQVLDNGRGIRNQPKFREGFGLGNIRTRLKQLYGDSQLLKLRDVVGGGLMVTVDIPLGNAL